MDMYPTINEWLQLPAEPGPHKLDGHSLRPLCTDPEASWSGPAMAVTAIGSDTPVDAATPADNDAQHYCVRSATHRYLRYCNGEEELYDHVADPYEWHNKADDPAYTDIKDTMRQELIAQTGIHS